MVMSGNILNRFLSEFGVIIKINLFYFTENLVT